MLRIVFETLLEASEIVDLIAILASFVGSSLVLIVADYLIEPRNYLDVPKSCNRWLAQCRLVGGY